MRSIAFLPYVLFILISFELISISCRKKTYFGCTKYYKLNMSLPSDYDCNLLAEKFSLDLHTFEAYNVDLDCDTLSGFKHSPSVCVQAHIPICIKDYTVKEEDTYDSIIEMNSVSKKRFHEINPFINVRKLNVGQVVCVSAKVSKTHHLNTISEHSSNLMDQVHSVDANVLGKYELYLNEPNSESAHEYMNSLTDLVKRDQNTRDIFKRFEETPEGKQLLMENGHDQEYACSTIDKQRYPKTSQCFCEQIESSSYCSIVFMEEVQDGPTKSVTIRDNNNYDTFPNTEIERKSTSHLVK